MDEIWYEHNDKLRHFILSRVNNIHDVEDILQEVFLKVYQNKDRFKGKSSVKTWIYSITRNTIIDYYRKRKDVLVTSDKLGQLIEETRILGEGDNCNREVSNYINDISRQIPNKYFEVFDLREKKTMKHKEIADKLGISVSASKVRHMRAKALLKDRLAKECHLNHDAYGNVIECSTLDKSNENCC